MGSKHYSDVRHNDCDNVENKGQRRATLPFLKIDVRHGGPHQGPLGGYKLYRPVTPKNILV